MSISLDPFSILPNLKADLSRVEACLEKEVLSDVDFLSQVTNHLIPAGGKRIRPGFTITAACLKDDGPVSDEVIAGAASMELVHLGSLYHDDVIDGAQKRRSIESVNAKYGDHIAILAGDFLLARASLLAASLGVEQSRLLAQTIASLCEGQILEDRAIANISRTPEEYLKAIEGKTASLLSCSCEAGALIAQNGAVELVGRFGHAYGMAFQIMDDISDLVRDGTELGKPVGNDIMEGNYTLSVIYALEESGSEELKEELENISAQQEPSWEQITKAREIVARSSGPARAKADAMEFMETASNTLEQLPEGNTTKVFEAGLETLSSNLVL